MNNYNDIPNGKLKQYQSEIDSWKQLLNTRMEKNVMLKNQLSDILKYKYDPNLLEVIEGFQAQFVSHDDDIFMLRKDAADLYAMLAGDPVGRVTGMNEKRIEALRKDMITSENQFKNLTSAFMDFQNEIYKRNGNEN